MFPSWMVSELCYNRIVGAGSRGGGGSRGLWSGARGLFERADPTIPRSSILRGGTSLDRRESGLGAAFAAV